MVKGHIEVHTLIGPPEVAVVVQDADDVVISLVVLTPAAARKLASSLLTQAETVEKLLQGGTN